MEIIFLKDHLEHKRGDRETVTEERGNYFVNTGVAEERKQKFAQRPAQKPAPKAPIKNDDDFDI